MKNWCRYCSDPLDKIERYEEAQTEGFEGWCIHHRLEIPEEGKRVSKQELIDSGLYYGRPASELMFMRSGEHIKLHVAGVQLPLEHRQKISKSLKGREFSLDHRKHLSMSKTGEQNPFYGKPTWNKGKHLSDATRKKLSMSHKGKCAGMLWWNDGISNKRSRACPGEGWMRGRLKR